MFFPRARDESDAHGACTRSILANGASDLRSSPSDRFAHLLRRASPPAWLRRPRRPSSRAATMISAGLPSSSFGQPYVRALGLIDSNPRSTGIRSVYFVGKEPRILPTKAHIFRARAWSAARDVRMLPSTLLAASDTDRLRAGLQVLRMNSRYDRNLWLKGTGSSRTMIDSGRCDSWCSAYTLMRSRSCQAR
jgi:hypothetical protein